MLSLSTLFSQIQFLLLILSLHCIFHLLYFPSSEPLAFLLVGLLVLSPMFSFISGPGARQSATDSA